jgi:hypothetical protein
VTRRFLPTAPISREAFTVEVREEAPPVRRRELPANLAAWITLGTGLVTMLGGIGMSIWSDPLGVIVCAAGAGLVCLSVGLESS